MVAIPNPSYGPITKTLPIHQLELTLEVILDDTIEFRFFWFANSDWIMPIGPCTTVGDRQFSQVKFHVRFFILSKKIITVIF